ncbi:MAG: hypothetical protein EOO02_21105 [Chitinophagaceae bacterium]|nr:MAG: hypothetical protein EOO02_21105 [Chitinophagaceae bacterium]
MKNTTNKTGNTDLGDSKRDQKKLESDSITMDMPEVKDIPGQENIKVPRMQEMEDVTASSADEEAEDLLKEINTEDETEIDKNSNVTEQEKSFLRKGAGHPRTEENNDIAKMSLDSTDDDGDELNEGNLREDKFGEDHDVPGADMDDDNEDIGEEDEENNQYS